MTGPQILQVIYDAIHDQCGGDDCGAEDMHREEAQAILFALSDADVLKVEETE